MYSAVGSKVLNESIDFGALNCFFSNSTEKEDFFTINTDQGYFVQEKSEKGSIYNTTNTFGHVNGEGMHFCTMISEGKIITNPLEIKNINRLKVFEALPENWNENGAPAFSNDLLMECKKILKILPKQPEIFPTAAKSIQMEYEKENGEYLEFNIYSERINVYRIFENEDEEEYTIKLGEYTKLIDLVENFYAGN